MSSLKASIKTHREQQTPCEAAIDRAASFFILIIGSQSADLADCGLFCALERLSWPISMVPTLFDAEVGLCD